MHAISSYRGNRPPTHTNTHPHKQTGPITIHCAAASAQCNNTLWYAGITCDTYSLNVDWHQYQQLREECFAVNFPPRAAIIPKPRLYAYCTNAITNTTAAFAYANKPPLNTAAFTKSDRSDRSSLVAQTDSHSEQCAARSEAKYRSIPSIGFCSDLNLRRTRDELATFICLHFQRFYHGE